MNETLEATPHAEKKEFWHPVLNFSNGGKQFFSSCYHTQKEALKAANRCKKLREENPKRVVADPKKNETVNY